MTDICERLVRFKDKVCVSSDVEIEAAAIIDKMFAKNADYRRRMSSFIFDYRNLEGECDALRAENARLTEINEIHQRAVADLNDIILHMQTTNARLREALKPFAGHANSVPEKFDDDRRISVGIAVGYLRAARAAVGESDE